MAATATITIEVDDKGATQAVQQIGGQFKQLDPALQKVGQRGNVVFTGMTTDLQRSRDAAALLSRLTGTELPRQLTRFLATSQTIGPALALAFNATIILTFAAAIARAISNLDEFRVGFSKLQTMSVVMVGQIKELLGLGGNVALERERFFKQQALFLPLIQRETALRQEAALTTLKGFAEIEERRRHERQNILDLESAQLRAAEQTFGQTEQFERAKTNIVAAAGNAMVAADQRAQQQRIALARGIADETRALESRAAVSALTGIDQIREQRKREVEEQRILLQRALITREDFARREVAIEGDAGKRITRLRREAAVAGQQEILQAEAQGSFGREKIEKEYVAKLQAITQQEINLGIELKDQRIAAQIEMTDKIRELERTNARDTTRMEEDAAVAVLPPWQRTNAQIALDAKRRVEDIQEQLRKHEISEQDAARRTAAVWQETFAKMRDELADKLQGLFDDITSGNIGKRFRDQFKHLVFQMIATWILGLQQMRAASATGFGGGGGGILGSLFGGLLGLGGIFGGGGSAGGPFGFPGTPPTFPAGGRVGGLGAVFGGFGAEPTAGLLGGLGLSAGGGISAGSVLPSGAALLGAGGGGGGLIGRLLGGGGGLAGLLGMGVLSGFGLTSRLGTFGGAALGAGLGLVGAGVGAFLFPALAAIPGIGWIAAGIGALLGGLFGFFGGRKKKKERDRLQHQLFADIQKTVDAYNFFQLDFAGALSQLEQIRQSYRDAFHKVGGDAAARVDPNVNRAISQIMQTEAERKRRAGLTFGPAEFSQGGLVAADARGRMLSFQGGGAVPAFLHPGEFVLRADAVKLIGRGQLEEMNRTGRPGGGDVHIKIYAWDGPSVQAWLRGGGGREIQRALLRGQQEGWA